MGLMVAVSGRGHIATILQTFRSLRNNSADLWANDTTELSNNVAFI